MILLFLVEHYPIKTDIIGHYLLEYWSSQTKNKIQHLSNQKQNLVNTNPSTDILKYSKWIRLKSFAILFLLKKKIKWPVKNNATSLIIVVIFSNEIYIQM